MTFFGRRHSDEQHRPGALAAADLPQATLSFCLSHGIHPIPIIYETVYTYLSCANEALSLAFSGELARGPLTKHAVLKLHDDHLPRGQAARDIGAIREGIGREVETVTDAVSAGIAAGSSAGSELTRLTDALERAPTPQAVIDSAGQIREIGLRQLSTNTHLREALRLTGNRLNELERELARHMEEANTDHLTKLPNRRAMDARLKRVFSRPNNTCAPTCIVMIDIDHFKAINDTHGHDIGDSVIRMISSLIQKGAGAEGYSARWGGEEFALLLDGSNSHTAFRIAEGIRSSLAGARWNRKKDGAPLGIITASFGIAERTEADSILTLLKRADRALYAAKAAGRNQTIYHNTD